MVEVYTPYALISLAGGILGALLVYGILTLKLFRLQLALSTTQQAVLNLRNKTSIEARWSKRDQEQAEFEALVSSKKSKADTDDRRFANDPLPYG